MTGLQLKTLLVTAASALALAACGGDPAKRGDPCTESNQCGEMSCTAGVCITPGSKELYEACLVRMEAFLEDLRQRVPVDFRTLVGYQVDPRAAGASVGGEFKNTDALDRVRWAVAQLTMELQVK